MIKRPDWSSGQIINHVKEENKDSFVFDFLCLFTGIKNAEWRAEIEDNQSERMEVTPFSQR